MNFGHETGRKTRPSSGPNSVLGGRRALQGDSGGLGLGYVDINSVSFGGYPETELSQHNPVRDHQKHPVPGGEIKRDQEIGITAIQPEPAQAARFIHFRVTFNFLTLYLVVTNALELLECPET